MFVPVIMFATAAGIAAFWLDWTRKEHTDTWLPDGYVEHERAFMWSDAAACILLVTSGSLTIAGFDLGERIGYLVFGKGANSGFLVVKAKNNRICLGNVFGLGLCKVNSRIQVLRVKLSSGDFVSLFDVVK